MLQFISIIAFLIYTDSDNSIFLSLLALTIPIVLAKNAIDKANTKAGITSLPLVCSFWAIVTKLLLRNLPILKSDAKFIMMILQVVC